MQFLEDMDGKKTLFGFEVLLAACSSHVTFRALWCSCRLRAVHTSHASLAEGRVGPNARVCPNAGVCGP